MLRRRVAVPVVLALLTLVGGWGSMRTAHAQTEATTPTKSVAIIPPAEQPDLEVQSTFREPSGNDTLDAAEDATLAVTVTNQGGGPAREVRVALQPESMVQGVRVADTSLQSLSGPLPLGQVSSLAASTSKTFEVPLAAADVLAGGEVALAVAVEEKNGFGLERPHPLSVVAETYRPPRVSLAGFDVADMSDQKLQPDTLNTVRLRVQNSGEGPARALRAKVEVVEGGALAEKAGTEIDLGTVAPDTSSTLRVGVVAKADVDAIPLRVQLRSEEDPYATEETLTLPVAAPDRAPLVDRKIPEGDTTRKNAIAVVVGVRNYRGSSVPNVKYAERDARTVKKYLHKTLGFREGNIFELINPTKTDLQRVFGTSRTHRGELYDYLRTDSTEVFVYYSGHGAPNPEENGRAYFVPSNGSPTQLSITGYPVKQLYENLAKVTSGPVTVAVDACFSGQSEGGTLIKNASPALLNVENPMVGMQNGMVLTASEADQVSSWYPEKKHGLFTYFLLKGLRGEADQNRDNLLTGAEMKRYLSENVTYYARRLHSRTQNPQVMGKGADRVLVRYPSSDPTSSSESGASGAKPDDTGGGTDAGSPRF
jgi:uncharacterized caspase-like protein